MSDKLHAAYGCCDCVVVNEAGHIMARLQWAPSQSREDRMSLAKLMAAAPDLAEAVRLVLARLDAPRDENLLRLALDSDRAEKACRAALEKAGLR